MRHVTPRDRILRSVEMGIVLAFLAAGLLFLASRADPAVREPFIVAGVIELSLGLGFLVAAVVSFGVVRSMLNRLPLM